MASAINYNTVWTSIFEPLPTFGFLRRYGRISPLAKRHDLPYHVVGSDLAGVVLRTGPGVNAWKPGDQVVAHCLSVELESPDGHDDTMLDPEQRIWGFETNFGGLAELALVKSNQLMPKPAHLTWEEAASPGLVNSTAYRQLVSRNGAGMKQGDTVLIWGASGGLGSYATQFALNGGATPVCVVSSPEKAEICRAMGAELIIDRNAEGYRFWNDEHTQDPKEWKRFGARIRELTGGDDPDIVFEHPGRETFGASVYVARKGGTIVTCASTSGFEHQYDNRYLWMNLKRIVGSHFANYREAWEANRLIAKGLIHPTLSKVYPLERDRPGRAGRAPQQPPGQGRRAGLAPRGGPRRHRPREAGAAPRRRSTASAGSDTRTVRTVHPRYASVRTAPSGGAGTVSTWPETPLRPFAPPASRWCVGDTTRDRSKRICAGWTRRSRSWPPTGTPPSTSPRSSPASSTTRGRARSGCAPRCARLVSPPQSVQGMSERMRSMLRLAEDEVAEMLQRANNEVTKNLHDAEQKAAGIVEEARAEADAIRMQSKADAEAAEEADTRRRAELEAAESAHHERLAASRETAEREIAEARARLAAEQQEHAEASTARRRRSRAQALRRVDGVGDPAPSGGGGFPHRDGPAPQGGAHRAHGRAARHPRGHRGDARARARRGQADGRGRAAGGGPDRGRRPGGRAVRLREQRQRIVAQLAASRADLDQLVDRARTAPGRAGFRAGHPAHRLARRPALARVHAHAPPALIAAPVVAPDRHAHATSGYAAGLRRRGRPSGDGGGKWPSGSLLPGLRAAPARRRRSARPAAATTARATAAARWPSGSACRPACGGRGRPSTACASAAGRRPSRGRPRATPPGAACPPG